MKKIIVKSICSLVYALLMTAVVCYTIRDFNALTCALDKVYYLIADMIAALSAFTIIFGIGEMFYRE